MIPNHPSWRIIDSTKLNAYLDCPRSYFYEYILGWRSVNPSIHLEFGKAWHYAMEHLLLHGYSQSMQAEAWSLLVDHYRKFWGPEWDEPNAPKNPGCALRALNSYCSHYEAEDRDQSVLYTEVAGTVPIAENRVLHFRMDSIIETPKGIISREHKTGTTLSRQWTDQWQQSVQTGTYNHALYCLYPYESVKGIEINGTFFLKTMDKFQRLTVRRSKEMMRDWFWNVNNTFDLIEWDQERLMQCTESDPILMAFAKNTQSCTKYFGCRFADFCMAWPNPLRRALEGPPEGFKVEWWDPSEEESKQVFNFTQTPQV